MGYLAARPLVEGEDYLVLEESPAYKRSPGSDSENIRRSRSAVKVFAPDHALHGESEVYLCRECRQYVCESVQGIHAHQQAHKPKPQRTVDESTALKVVAFNLLPDKIKVKMLAQARELMSQ